LIEANHVQKDEASIKICSWRDLWGGCINYVNIYQHCYPIDLKTCQVGFVKLQPYIKVKGLFRGKEDLDLLQP